MQGEEIAFTFDTKHEARSAIARVEGARLCFSSGMREIRGVWMVNFRLKGPNFVEEGRAQVIEVVKEEPFVIEMTVSSSRTYSTA